MSRLRITISGEQGTGKSTIALALANTLRGGIPIVLDGERLAKDSHSAPSESVYHGGVTEIEIVTLTEKAGDFADSLLGKVEGKRFSKADAEVAHHVRRLLECGLLPVGVARRMLSKSAKGKPGGDLITDPGSGMVTDRQGHVVKP